jgi:hypothetical protein
VGDGKTRKSCIVTISAEALAFVSTMIRKPPFRDVEGGIPILVACRPHVPLQIESSGASIQMTGAAPVHPTAHGRRHLLVARRLGFVPPAKIAGLPVEDAVEWLAFKLAFKVDSACRASWEMDERLDPKGLRLIQPDE